MTAEGEHALATVRRLFDAFAARDADAAVAVLHPDLEFWAQPTAERADRAATYAGHDGFRAYLADVDRVWERFTVAPDDFRVAGGGVIAFGAAEGVDRATGTALHLPVIWVFRLRDGLIVFGRVARTAAEATELAAGRDAASG